MGDSVGVPLPKTLAGIYEGIDAKNKAGQSSAAEKQETVSESIARRKQEASGKAAASVGTNPKATENAAPSRAHSTEPKQQDKLAAMAEIRSPARNVIIPPPPDKLRAIKALMHELVSTYGQSFSYVHVSCTDHDRETPHLMAVLQSTIMPIRTVMHNTLRHETDRPFAHAHSFGLLVENCVFSRKGQEIDGAHISIRGPGIFSRHCDMNDPETVEAAIYCEEAVSLMSRDVARTDFVGSLAQEFLRHAASRMMRHSDLCVQAMCKSGAAVTEDLMRWFAVRPGAGKVVSGRQAAATAPGHP